MLRKDSIMLYEDHKLTLIVLAIVSIMLGITSITLIIKTRECEGRPLFSTLAIERYEPTASVGFRFSDILLASC